MEIEEYLKQKERRLERTSERISDFRVFDFDYMPERPLMREEVKPLADAILRYLKTGIPNHLLVIGSRGSGKTLLVRYITRRLTERHGGRAFYVNCRHHNTSFKILAELLEVRPRGFSLDELWTRFEEVFPSPALILLDEVDLISEKDHRKDILYLLSRSGRRDMVVLLSNHPHFDEQLDASTRSTLQPEIVHFKNYDAEQLRAIFEQRARLGLKRYEEREVAHLAGLVARYTHADVRVGIKTLYLSAMEPDAALEENFHRARRDIVAEVIRGLSAGNLLILRAASLVPEPQVKAVYARYRQLSASLGETPFSYVYFYSNLAYLQSVGLILLVAVKVSRAYTREIQLLFEREAMESVWAARFGRE